MSSLLRAREWKRIPVRCHLLASLLTGVAGILALSSVAHAANIPLTLEEAQRRAILRSSQLSAQDFTVAAAREMAVAAGQLPDPVLTLGLDSWPVNGPNRFSFGDDDFTMGRVAVAQEWTRAEKRQLRTQRQNREGDKTQAEKTATVAEIQRDTALAWLDRYYAEAMAAVIAEQHKAVAFEIVMADSAYRGGRGNQADVIAAHSALVDLEDRASEINSRVRTAKTRLARWVGEAAELPLAGKPAIDVVQLDRSALETQLAHHPQVALLDKQQELAWTEAKLAEANKHADWSVELAYAQRGSGFSDFVSVNVSIPLQFAQKNRQDREVAAKLALAQQVGAEREEAVRMHVGEVLAQLETWENSRERLARYARDTIPLAAVRTHAALAAYRGGKATSTDLLLARRDEIDLRLRAVELERKTARLWGRLNFLFPEDHQTPAGAAAANPRTLDEELK